MEESKEKVTFVNRFRVSVVTPVEECDKPMGGEESSALLSPSETGAPVLREVQTEAAPGVSTPCSLTSENKGKETKRCHDVIMVRRCRAKCRCFESDSIFSSVSSEFSGEEVPVTHQDRCIEAQTLRDIIDRVLAKLSARESPTTSSPAVSLRTHLFIHVAALLENAGGISVSHAGVPSGHFSAPGALVSIVEGAADKLLMDSVEKKSVLHGVREGSERDTQYMGEALAVEICKVVAKAPLDLKEEQEEGEKPNVSPKPEMGPQLGSKVDPLFYASTASSKISLTQSASIQTLRSLASVRSTISSTKKKATAIPSNMVPCPKSPAYEAVQEKKKKPLLQRISAALRRAFCFGRSRGKIIRVQPANLP